MKSEKDPKLINNDIKTPDGAHMHQLDGLRAIAVLFVLVHHYFMPMGMDAGMWAFVGVKFLFVLSGFLITRILIKNRFKAEAQLQSRAQVARKFHIRRFLRIFPLYYFIIAIALLLNLEGARENVGWLLTFTLNIHMSNLGWFVANFAHLWALAVEEQFYIVWPMILLFWPKKHILKLAILIVLIGPLFRLYEVVKGFKALETYILTLASMDNLGMGVLLATLMELKNTEFVKKFLKFFALPVGLCLSVALYFAGRTSTYGMVYVVLFDTFLSLFSMWVIGSASFGFPGIVGRFLQLKPLTNIGKISYGIYVYHPFMPQLCGFLAVLAGFRYSGNGWTAFVIHTIATCLVASVSWRYLEEPFNNLKRFFEYKPTKRALDSVAGAN